MTKSNKVNIQVLALFIALVMVTMVLYAKALKETNAITESKDKIAQTTKNVRQEDLFDVTTCGPAAVGIVLRIYGKSSTLEEIGRDTWIDADHRTTVKSLSEALTRRGIYARGRKLNLEELKKQTFPAIILAQSPRYAKDENHFLVYVGSDESKIRLLDPLGFIALKAIPAEVFQKEWNGVVIVTQLTPFKKFQKSRTMKWNILMSTSVGLLIIALVLISVSIGAKNRHRKIHCTTGCCRIVMCVVCVVMALVFMSLGLWWIYPVGESKLKKPNPGSIGDKLLRSDIVFDINHMDLGEHFAESAPFVARFQFQNTGNDIIELVTKTCCGAYASFKENKVQYAPNEKGEVILKIFDPGPRQQNPVVKSVMILHKEKGCPIAKLEAVVSVKRHWRVRPFQLKYGRIKPGEKKQTELVIEAGTDEERGIIHGFEVDSPFLQVTQIDQDAGDSRQQRHKYQISLTGGKVARDFLTNIVFHTTTPKVPQIVVPVTAEFTGMITIRPRSLYFGQISSQSAVSKSLRIVSNNDDPIEIIRTSCNDTSVYVSERRLTVDAKRVDLDVGCKVPANARGILRGTIEILCKNSEEFEINIPWVAVVGSLE